ncbi:hypothetical protein [Halalkalibacterium ligniniphilum]|uniref:hypothetical protein n=1 Tax=Halalkalibacterium ligniniphilum TaxID=1134413 RepID=UPI000348CF9C|nr:hypothetical protein [Halalkalibacterium ligniniphilum]
MKFKNKCVGLRCPEVVSPKTPDDFCIPKEYCPKQKKTPKFPSPNTCFPNSKLEDLEMRIRKANDFLLDLALSSKREKNEVFKKAFEGLLHQNLIVELDCKTKIEEGDNEVIEGSNNHTKLQGTVVLAGRDFTILKNKQNKLLIPYEKISLVKLRKSYHEPTPQPLLSKIDPCLRRCLTFQFGEVVSGSPELIQIFFGLDLKVYLLLMIDKKIKLVSEVDTIVGTLLDVYADSINICLGEMKSTMNIHDVCYIIA